MKLLNYSITRIIVAVMFVFSITGNVFAWYHKDGNWLVCDYCGAKYINSFPRDGHYSWCKYAPATSSGSSAVYVPKTTSSSSDYAAASMATAALGSMISDLISGSGKASKPAKTQEQIAAEKAAKAEQLEKIKAQNEKTESERKNFLKDEQFWKSGDYVVKEGNLKLKGAKAYGVYNTKTQKWVLSADKQKDNEERIVVFRKFNNSIYTPYETGHIRLLNCKDENSSYNRTLVCIEYAYSYYKKKKTWTKTYGRKFFVINDNDELDKLDTFEGYNFFVNQNGKCGVADIVEDSIGWGDYCGYKIIIPIEYDSIEIFNNFEDKLKDKTIAFRVYLAKNKDDVYIFGSFGKRLSPKLAEYDSITKLLKLMDDFYMVSKDNKFGAVDGSGTVLVPLIYSDPISFYDSVKDMVPMVSFTNWYRNKVKPYLTTKSKYEKESDFQARMNDPKKQEQYVAEKMKNAGKDYVDEFKNKISVELGSYDAETEKFVIKEYVNFAATKKTVTETVKYEGDKKITTKNYSDDSKKLLSWNTIELSVPTKEAEAFEKNFKNMTEDALKNATYGICCDVIAIAKITFKMPNGKTYTFDSTKNGK